jgi:SET domain-containing protein
MNVETLIEFRDSAIHGTGGFARGPIPAGARIVEYLGRRIYKPESLRQCELDNPYIFFINEQFDLDGNVEWNPARLLNHSCSPNSEAQLIGETIWIIALRNIAAQEEITFNYNYDLVDFREHPCRCGAKNCVGYIVAPEFFEAVRKSAGKPLSEAPVT